MTTLSVIVPTYNEAENVQELLERIKSSLGDQSFDVVVVDDNSPDGTADVVERLSVKWGNIKLLRRRGKMGLGSAVVDGMKVADGKIIVVMDADLQHPPELLPKMINKASEGYDIIVASRYMDGGSIEKWGTLRRIVSKGAAFLAHLLFLKTRAVRDVVSGFFLFKKGVVEGVRLSPTGYKILLEILVKGRYGRVAEVPYTFKPRKRGRSKLGLTEIINYAFFLLRLRLRP
jgi:dolichol-phosphate mannosyltransferase